METLSLLQIYLAGFAFASGVVTAMIIVVALGSIVGGGDA